MLVAVRSGDNGFNMTESGEYSLVSVHSKESLGGAHFEIFATEEGVNEETSIPKYIKFTIKELEMNQEEISKELPLETE